MTPAEALIESSRDLLRQTRGLRFSGPVTHVYNPLEYAWHGWTAYLHLAAQSRKRVVLLGMNPGPWGMAQTGVPFGEVNAVRIWMGIGSEAGVVIGTPQDPHPKRPIHGFRCPRSEVSGRRLWGLMAERFGSAEVFFADHFVANYCPLVFMGETGRNITPDKLPAAERAALFELCDDYLSRTIDVLEPRFVIGIGRFAESRIRAGLAHSSSPNLPSRRTAIRDVVIGSILHPSPASPAANRDWAGTATRQLVNIGAWS